VRESDLLRLIYEMGATPPAGGEASGAGTHRSVLVGPGDDCAVVRSPSGDVLLLTVDQLIAGRHFLASDTPVDLVARKAVARSISDIAAMGGTPAWGLATAALPPGYPHACELAEAIHRWGRHWSCPIVGGDLATLASADHPLTITTTVVGVMEQGIAPVLRSGARAGDAIWLTGRVGGSFASDRHLTFEPRIEIGRALARLGAHAMIDLSDGLGRDAARIGEASGVRLIIDAALVPVHAGADGAPIPWRDAVREGEDYELLVCAPEDMVHTITSGPAHAPPPLLGPIGFVRALEPNEPAGASIVDENGQAHDAGELGWDHAG
jgi:thiamine-monophosphate kinase